jgi:2-keto-4-pentenoate hydratase/2-oxohepta-3-ene-1,7-dioic acid hydratase in catechol pathway
VLPIDRPGKIVCVGLNYRDHAEEQGVELPAEPLLFAKWQTALIGRSWSAATTRPSSASSSAPA